MARVPAPSQNANATTFTAPTDVIAGDQTRASPLSITDARAALACGGPAVLNDESRNSTLRHLHWIDRVYPDATRRLREEFPLPPQAAKGPIVQICTTALQ